MKIQDAKMVHPAQIVRKGFKGCKSTRTVKSFCQKNQVPHVWWKPRGNPNKIMLVEMSSFASAWKDQMNQQSTTTRTTAPARKTSRTRANARTTKRSSRTTMRSNKRTTARTNGATARTRSTRTRQATGRTRRAA